MIELKKVFVSVEKVKVCEMRRGVINTKIDLGKDILNIWAIYNTGKLIEIVEFLGNEIKTEEEEKLIIGGDFNIRIGNLGRIRGMTERGEEIARESKDMTRPLNKARAFVEFIEDKG